MSTSCQVAESLVPVPSENAAWYAIHTRSRHEKRVASELERKGIKTFLPLSSETRQWSDRRMNVEVPLFSCYAFVNIDSSAASRVEVLRTVGVLSFVGGNQRSASVPDAEILSVQMLLANKVGFSHHPFVSLGQKVRVRGGALQGMEGILTRFNGSSRLVISVETIQRSLSITVDGYDVEPVDPDQSGRTQPY